MARQLGWIGSALVALGFWAVGCAAGLPPRPRPLAVRDPEAAIAEYYRRANAEDLVGLLALMVEEPILEEPFSSPPRATTHRGYAAVARFFQAAFRGRDDQIVAEFVRIDGPRATVGWSLLGSDGVAISGTTVFTLRGARIAAIRIEQRD